MGIINERGPSLKKGETKQKGTERVKNKGYI